MVVATSQHNDSNIIFVQLTYLPQTFHCKKSVCIYLKEPAGTNRHYKFANNGIHINIYSKNRNEGIRKAHYIICLADKKCQMKMQRWHLLVKRTKIKSDKGMQGCWIGIPPEFNNENKNTYQHNKNSTAIMLWDNIIKSSLN